MAYNIVSAEEINSRETGLGISFTAPINKVFSPIRITIDQALENLKNLLLTRIGERYMQPNFGTQLLNIIFEPNVSELKTEIEDIIREPVSFWLPYISLDAINTITAEDQPQFPHNAKISILFSVDGFERKNITLVANTTGTIEIGETNE